jgi:hypothetical protein
MPRVEPVAQRGSRGALDENDGPVADDCGRSEAPGGVYDPGEGSAEREESSEESSRMSDEIAEDGAEDAGDNARQELSRCPRSPSARCVSA